MGRAEIEDGSGLGIGTGGNFDFFDFFDLFAFFAFFAFGPEAAL